MRIIYLHQYFNTPDNAGGTRSYEMARRLVAAGHTVNMVTSYRNKPAKKTGWFKTIEAGIHVHWIPVPYSNNMSYQERILAFFKFAILSAQKAASLPGDVVFATSTPLTIALSAVYAARRKKIPMVFEVRDLWPELPIAIKALRGAIPIAAARRLEKFAYDHAAAVVALSPGMKEGVVQQGYPANKVHIIPNSCDLELFQVPRNAGVEFRATHKWLEDRPLVVYTGAFGRINGVSYLVHLAAAVKEITPEIRFLTVGKGYEVNQVNDLAQHLGVLNNNFFMMDVVPKNEMPALLSAATIATSLFVDLPAMWANSANKFFDALAAGCPIAINYKGWQAAILNKTAAGLVLPPKDIPLAARKLVSALEDQQWLDNAGIAATKLAREKFDRNLLAKQLEDVLLSTQQKRKPSPASITMTACPVVS